MSKKSIILFLLAFSLMLVISGCSVPEPTIDENQVATIVAGTKTAQFLEATTVVEATEPVNEQEGIDSTAEAATQEVSTAMAATATAAPSSTPTLTPSPTPTPTPTGPTPTPDCVDKGTFVSETIKDGTTFFPGEKFEKTWVIKNVGTCTWTTDYALVIWSGELLGATSPSPLLSEVLPNQNGEFTITFTAPDKTGDYRSEWKIQNKRQEVFGLGTNADKPFWVQIKVVESSSALDLGTPDWIDTFDTKSNTFPLGEYAQTEYSIDNGKLEMKASEPAGDQWRMASRPALADFYIEGVFQTGKVCSGKDSYGMILRSPDSVNNIVDSGYVFVFSCDGYYRFYRMDDGTYVGIQNWTSAPNLNKGPNQENRVGILAVGDSLKVFINSALVVEFIDSTYEKGIFGLVIRSVDTYDLEIFVDQLATWNVP
jgi:hypothetical protein